MSPFKKFVRVFLSVGAALGSALLSGVAIVFAVFSRFFGPQGEDNYAAGMLGLIAVVVMGALILPAWVWLLLQFEKASPRWGAGWVFWLVILLGNSAFLIVLV